MGAALDAILLESYDLNISAIVEENPGWSQRMVNDYFSKQSNINSLAKITDVDGEQIIINRDNIAVLQGEMIALTIIVTKNTADIIIVQDNLDTHEASDSAHGVAGDNVGTLDYCSSLIGGVVLLAANVADAAVMTTEITTSDISTAPATYSAIYTATQTFLLNECKAKINTLITDIESIKTQLNEVISTSKTAKQRAL